MVRLKSETLEFRGVAKKQSAKGNEYALMYCECADGQPEEFYLKQVPEGVHKLKKGDKVVVYCVRNKYKELDVLDVVKADAGN